MGCFPFFGENTQKLLNMNASLHNQPEWALWRLGPGASPGCSVLVTQQKSLLGAPQGQTDVGTDTHPHPPVVVQTSAWEPLGSNGCLGWAPEDGVLAGVGREGCIERLTLNINLMETAPQLLYGYEEESTEAQHITSVM